MFLYYFDMLMLKIILKNKKNYFNEFYNEKHFKKQLLLYSQTPSKPFCVIRF